MHSHTLEYSKGQMKIQQMAFMIIAIVIFFSMVALIYFAITLSQLKGTAQDLAEEEAMELAYSFSGTPELFFTADADCANCIDLDKAFAMKQLNQDKKYYNNLWNIEYLQIEKVYPAPDSNNECDISAYNTNSCKFITIKNSSSYTARTAIVALVIRDSAVINGGYRYELGRIYVSAKNITK